MMRSTVLVLLLLTILPGSPLSYHGYIPVQLLTDRVTKGGQRPLGRALKVLCVWRNTNVCEQCLVDMVCMLVWFLT